MLADLELAMSGYCSCVGTELIWSVTLQDLCSVRLDYQPLGRETGPERAEEREGRGRERSGIQPNVRSPWSLMMSKRLNCAQRDSAHASYYALLTRLP